MLGILLRQNSLLYCLCVSVSVFTQSRVCIGTAGLLCCCGSFLIIALETSESKQSYVEKLVPCKWDFCCLFVAPKDSFSFAEEEEWGVVATLH